MNHPPHFSMDKVTTLKIRHLLSRLNSKLKLAAKRISGYAERKLEVIQCEEQKKLQRKIN